MLYIIKNKNVFWLENAEGEKIGWDGDFVAADRLVFARFLCSEDAQIFGVLHNYHVER